MTTQLVLAKPEGLTPFQGIMHNVFKVNELNSGFGAYELSCRELDAFDHGIRSSWSGGCEQRHRIG